MKAMTSLFCAAALLFVSCAKRVPVYDEAGQPISEREIKYYQGNKNFALYTLGGGALSFGASFFLGTLVERSIDENDDNNGALWLTTGVGTGVGTVLFAYLGKKRDRSQAIETAKEVRKRKLERELVKEKIRKKRLEAEMKALEAERKRQEAEKRKLMEEIKKKKRSNPEDH